MKFRVRHTAAQDIQEGAIWYHSAQTGLGERFVGAIDAVLSQIAEHPQAAPVVRDPLRRWIVRDFPYSVFYLVDDQGVTVARVLHYHRDPRLVQNIR